MKFVSLVALVSCLVGQVSGFSLAPNKNVKALTLLQGSSNENNNHNDNLLPSRVIGGVALASALFFGSVAAPPAAFADPMMTNTPSSSLLISEAIKTLDMSMPSYDAVKGAEASVENVQGLAVEPVKKAPEPVTSAGKPERKPDSAAAEKAAKKKAEAEAKAAARAAFERENLIN